MLGKAPRGRRDVVVPLRRTPKYELMLPQIVEMAEAGSGIDLISRALGLGAEVVRDALYLHRTGKRPPGRIDAAFVRGMPNFDTIPPAPGYEGDVVVYHAMPYSLRDPLRRPVNPDLFVDTTPVLETQRKALAAHVSQLPWIDASQGACVVFE